MALTESEVRAFDVLRQSGVETSFAENELDRTEVPAGQVDLRLWTAFVVARGLGPEGLPAVQRLVDGIGLAAIQHSQEVMMPPATEEFWRSIVV